MNIRQKAITTLKQKGDVYSCTEAKIIGRELSDERLIVFASARMIYQVVEMCSRGMKMIRYCTSHSRWQVSLLARILSTSEAARKLQVSGYLLLARLSPQFSSLSKGDLAMQLASYDLKVISCFIKQNYMSSTGASSPCAALLDYKSAIAITANG